MVSKCLRTPPTDGCYLIDLCWRPQGTTEPLKHNPGTTVITSSPLSPPRSASSRELEGFCCLLPNEPEHYNVVESTLLLRFLLLDYVDHMQGQQSTLNWLTKDSKHFSWDLSHVELLIKFPVKAPKANPLTLIIKTFSISKSHVVTSSSHQGHNFSGMKSRV